MKEDKPIVLITGCSSGIGRALTREFADNGFRVCATARNKESISDLESEMVSAYALDVNNNDSIREAVSNIISKEGRVDYLVNNAGILVTGPLAEIPLEKVREQFETNVAGPLAMIQEVVPHMVRQKSGRIINIGSISAIMVTPFGGIYSGSKAELHALSDALRVELAPFGIKVICSVTGGVKSSLSNKASMELKKDSMYRQIGDYIHKRTFMSQENATETEVFAKEFVRKVTAKKPDPVIKIAWGARYYSILKRLLPVKVLDNMRAKKFGLDKLR